MHERTGQQLPPGWRAAARLRTTGEQQRKPRVTSRRSGRKRRTARRAQAAGGGSPCSGAAAWRNNALHSSPLPRRPSASTEWVITMLCAPPNPFSPAVAAPTLLILRLFVVPAHVFSLFLCDIRRTQNEGVHMPTCRTAPALGRSLAERAGERSRLWCPPRILLLLLPVKRHCARLGQ